MNLNMVSTKHKLNNLDPFVDNKSIFKFAKKKKKKARERGTKTSNELAGHGL